MTAHGSNQRSGLRVVHEVGVDGRVRSGQSSQLISRLAVYLLPISRSMIRTEMISALWPQFDLPEFLNLGGNRLSTLSNSIKLRAECDFRRMRS